MRNLFSLPLGASPHPLAFKRDPLSALGLGSIASGVIGGIGNMVGSLFSNSSNKKIAREQMDWQTKERNASQKWQEYMWNQNNLYNSPSAIKARLQEAGYNPWLSGSEQVGQGATMPSAPSMPSAPNMPTQQPVNFGAPFAGMAAPLFNVAQLELQRQGVDADVSNKEAKTFEQVLKNAHEMRMQGEPRAAIHRYVSQNTPYATGIGDDRAYFDFLNKFRENEARADMAQFEYRLALNYGENERSYKVQALRNSVGEIASKMILNLENANYTHESLRKIDPEIAELFSRARKNNAEAETAEQLRQYLIDKIEAEIGLMDKQSNILSPEAEYSGSTFGKYEQVIQKRLSQWIKMYSNLLPGGVDMLPGI